MCNNLKIKNPKFKVISFSKQHVFFARKPLYFLKTNPRRTENCSTMQNDRVILAELFRSAC